MNNFGFMSSGTGDTDGGAYYDNFNEFMTAVLSLFISKSLENSVKYVEICNRDGVTKNDLELALKHQAFDFFKNPNLNEELEELREEIRQEIREYEEYGSDYSNDEAEDGSGDEAEDGSGDEAEDGSGDEAEENNSQETENANYGLASIDDLFHGIQTAEDVQPFKRANLRDIEIEKRNFVHEFHIRTDNWESWKPENDIEKAIFNAIEQMTSHF